MKSSCLSKTRNLKINDIILIIIIMYYSYLTCLHNYRLLDAIVILTIAFFLLKKNPVKKRVVIDETKNIYY